MVVQQFLFMLKHIVKCGLAVVPEFLLPSLKLLLHMTRCKNKGEGTVCLFLPDHKANKNPVYLHLQ